MAEKLEETLATNGSMPFLISVTPAQIDQFHSAMAFFDQFKNLMQGPEAKSTPASPADANAPQTEKPPLATNPTPPPVEVQASKDSTPSTSSFSATASITHSSSTAAHTSSSPPTTASTTPTPSRTKYEYAQITTGERSFRRSRKRIPPALYDPAKDPRMIAHKAAHSVCSRIVRGMGFSGEW